MVSKALSLSIYIYIYCNIQSYIIYEIIFIILSYIVYIYIYMAF